MKHVKIDLNNLPPQFIRNEQGQIEIRSDWPLTEEDLAAVEANIELSANPVLPVERRRELVEIAKRSELLRLYLVIVAADQILPRKKGDD